MFNLAEMEDDFGKLLRLFGNIFLSLVGFIIALALLLLGIKLIFGLMEYIPWFTYVYMVFIILVPAALFIPAYIIYFTRTKKHPNKFIRSVSYLFFLMALVTWSVFLVLDIITFFKHAYPAIGMYLSYNMSFLAANVACFFLIGVMQAFTTPKEKDWMERNS